MSARADAAAAFGTPDAAAVTADAVVKEYRTAGGTVRALRGVSLSVERGRMVSIVGPSGCGKSTLLHLLGGVDVPTEGAVTLLGQDTRALPDARLAKLRLAHVGFVFQRFFLLPMLTAEENVTLPMLEAGVPASARRARAAALLERVGLAGRAGHRPGQLSGGEMQRVAIARALANRPALLLADEPTGELDDATGREIIRLLRDATRDGCAVVVVTHNAELASLADRQLRMRNGTVV
ncbi:MAG TPA: ABC transporter ATP-binding protein [bacterium]|nr:ABC transporter ATP-binding protein [bacterium]